MKMMRFPWSWTAVEIGLARCANRCSSGPAIAAAITLVASLVVTAAAAAAPKSINGFVGGPAGVNSGGLFTQPRDIAVYVGDAGDPSDDKIFVAEGLGNNNSRVQRLDADGNFELAWGKDVVSAGAPGNTGTGFEVCTQAVSGASSCKGGSAGTEAGEFDDPNGVVVNQASGHVFVLDRDNRRVQEFDLDGGFVRAWGWDVVEGNVETGFEICTDVNQCKAGSTGGGAGQFSLGSPPNGTGLALHPTTGDVFVSDPGSGSTGNRRIMQFESDGDFIRAWGYGVDDGTAQFQVCTATSLCQAALAAGTENGRFANSNPTRIAVDADGIVYASDTADGGRIIRFDSDLAPTAPGPPFPDASGALLAPLSGTTFLTAATTVGLEVDPDSDNLLIARDPASGATVVEEIADPGTATPTIAENPPHTYTDLGTVNGMGYSPTNDNIYLALPDLFVSSFTGCASTSNIPCAGLLVLALSSGPLQASLAIPLAEDLGPTTATLEGTVDAAGGVASYRFQLCAANCAVEESWVDAGEAVNLAGSGDVAVSRDVVGLEPATPYQARLVIKKQTAMDTTAEAISSQVFVTEPAAPDVQTLSSAHRRATSVELRGRVDPNGAETSYRFEYGLAGGPLDEQVPVSDISAGSGNSLVLVMQQLQGLTPETAYDYRIVATNEVGTTVGDVVSFQTTEEALPKPPIGRGYELVSPADKVGSVGVGVWYGGPAAVGFAGLAAQEGERFAVQGTLGSVLVDGAYAYVDDWALSERTPEGWVSRPGVSRRAHGRQNITSLAIVAAAPDLSLTAWGSNGHTVKLFEEQENWDEGLVGDVLLLRDWTEGNWEVFGPTEPEQGGGLGTAATAIADGSAAVAAGPTRGLAGPGDPTHPGWSDLVAGLSVYLDELLNGLSNTFPGEGVRSLVNVCTAGTVLPERLPSGVLDDRPCPAPTERHLVAVDATGGSFVLDVDGESTGAIAFDAPASGAGSVQQSLEALSNVDPGDVEVGYGPGGAGATKPYFVRWIDPPLSDVPELLVDGSLLTGGGATANVETVVVDPLISDRGASLGSDTEGMISEDGSRAFFLAPDPALGSIGGPCGTVAPDVCPPQLYVRQREGNGFVTRWISRSEVADQDASLMGPVIFEGASKDGDKVFFRTASPLTADDPNGEGSVPPGGWTSGNPDSQSVDLYMYDLPDGPSADPSDGELTRISAGPSGDGDCNSPLGGMDTLNPVAALRFASDDGSRLYFTCARVLPGVAQPSNATITSPAGNPSDGSASNLYAYDATRPSSDRWRFVARLPRSSPLGTCASTGHRPTGSAIGATDGTNPVPVLANAANCLRGTADGSFVTFWTDGRLTVDDPDSETGDVYAYDAERDELARVSKPQGGTGNTYQCLPGGGPVQCFGDGGIGTQTLPLPRLGVALTPDGERLAFFESRSRLLPQDTDDAYDVYQWRDGELTLLSPGDSDTDGAFFVGNDRSGRNVYVATRDRLTWQDTDSVLDVYTVRIGGGIPQPPPPPVCDLPNDGCQGVGADPLAPGGSGPSGEGNASPPPRIELSLTDLSAKARKRAARTGIVPVKVRVSGGTLVNASARARIAGRLRAVGSARRKLQKAGMATLRLRLSGSARRRLRSGKALRIRISVRATSARARTMSATLDRGSR